VIPFLSDVWSEDGGRLDDAGCSSTSRGGCDTPVGTVASGGAIAAEV